jgi:hypothetical protein
MLVWKGLFAFFFVEDKLLVDDLAGVVVFLIQDVRI